jgi:hypothetical protein
VVLSSLILREGNPEVIPERLKAAVVAAALRRVQKGARSRTGGTLRRNVDAIIRDATLG